MAGRFINPLPQFMDSTPTMYAGAKLFFYATGTSTKLNTYTTKALSVANSNPVVLDSAGRLPNDVFLQDLEYKVVLAPSTDTDPPTSPIWTADPVSHRDSQLVAKTLTGSGSPNGSVAGTAGSASILPDFYWDYTNSILYVCTTTGTTSTAVWTAINASSATAAVPPPQGRLTLTSATPVVTGDVTAATAVYYTPFVGNLVPIYNGTTMIPTEFSELTLSLVASHAANIIYDLFVFSNSGVLTLVSGPAWSVSTAGSGARGSGASTTQLTRIKGMWVNAVSITGRNGSTTYSIGANLATYVGSMYMDGSNGQLSVHGTFGQSRKYGLWNAYNRSPITVKAGDATASWTAGGTQGGTLRPANNATANSITLFSGLPEEGVAVSYLQRFSAAPGGSATVGLQSGIGFNSTTAASGTNPYTFLTAGAVAAFSIGLENTARYDAVPFLGINVVTALEGSTPSNPSVQGTEANMALTAMWRA